MAVVRGGPRAGFWRRFAGALIDGIFLGIVDTIFRRLFGPRAGVGIGLLASLIYFTALIGADRGQTLGQMALGIRVIDENTGEPIGPMRALVRWVVSIISGIVLLLGYLWMLWDGEKQCWHDKAAHDVVVHVRDYPLD
jgi:uncharacterized RDD family membrane protein YckC